MLRPFILLIIVDVAVFGAQNTTRPPILDGKIVGGEDAYIEEYPYQISLLRYGFHTCGGSIISPYYVVTAAHCTDGSSASQMAIRAGSSFRNKGGVVVKIREIFQHPLYDTITIDYDISVLYLKEKLSFGASISKVYLPEEDQKIAPDSDCVVTGWGLLKEENGLLASQLQSVMVKLISKDYCDSAYGYREISPRMVCAGVSGGGKDSCQGDSGGPLVSNGQLIGIVSWGYGCAEPRYPGVYTNVSALRDFITSTSGL